MRFAQRLKMEFIHAIPAILFFMISFNLITLTERLMARAEDIGNIYISHLTATIGALIIGKIIIIVNSFSFINLFPHRPLIFNIVWKFFVYGLCTLLFRMLESFLHFLDRYRDVNFAWDYLLMKLTSPLFWAIELWVLMVFIVYIVASEFVCALGREKVMELFFFRSSVD